MPLILKWLLGEVTWEQTLDHFGRVWTEEVEEIHEISRLFP